MQKHFTFDGMIFFLSWKYGGCATGGKNGTREIIVLMYRAAMEGKGVDEAPDWASPPVRTLVDATAGMWDPSEEGWKRFRRRRGAWRPRDARACRSL